MSSELRTKIMALIECCDTELVSSVTSTADHILALLTPPSELRAKIKSILQTELSTCDSLYDDIADRILALLPPPAWHDAVSVRPRRWEKVTIYTGIGSVVQGYFDGTNWRQEGKDNELIGVTHWRELPPPPTTPPATAKLPEGVVVCAMPDGRYHVRGCGWWLLKQGRWEKMTLPTHEYPGEFVSHDEALTAALSAPPVPGENKPTLGTSTRCSTCGFDGMNHMSTAARDAETIRSQAARIAELEAENTRLRAQYDMVEQERTRLMLGQQVPYTPAEKPDARLTAPNGRAMARYELCGPNREYNMHGIDDEGHDWAWAHEGMWIEPFPACMDSRRTPCTFDGTPITEMKPDPLARAVTVGEMLRLADLFEEKSFYKKAIRTVFPQGAAHAE